MRRPPTSLVVLGLLALLALSGCTTASARPHLVGQQEGADRADGPRLAGGNAHARHPETWEPAPDARPTTDAPHVRVPELPALREAVVADRALAVPCRITCAFVADGRMTTDRARLERLRAALAKDDLIVDVAAMRPPAEPPTGEPLTIEALARIARELGHDALLLLVTRPIADATEAVSIVVDTRDAAIVSVTAQQGEQKIGAHARDGLGARLARAAR